MAGIINQGAQAPTPAAQAAPQTAAQPTQGLTNPVLQKIQSGIDAKVAPELKKTYLSIIVSGMKVITSPQFSQRILQKLKASKDLTADVSSGVANVVATVYNEVGKSMPPQAKQQFVAAAGPASTALMCQVLDMATKAAGANVDANMAAQCAQATVMATLQKFGIDQNKMHQAIAAGQQKQGV